MKRLGRTWGKYPSAIEAEACINHQRTVKLVPLHSGVFVVVACAYNAVHWLQRACGFVQGVSTDAQHAQGCVLRSPGCQLSVLLCNS